MNKKIKYQNGGFISSSTGNDTFGAGDDYISPRDAGMELMAKGGGLMGFMNGGSVLDSQMGKGGTKKGMIRKTARKAYNK